MQQLRFVAADAAYLNFIVNGIRLSDNVFPHHDKDTGIVGKMSRNISDSAVLSLDTGAEFVI